MGDSADKKEGSVPLTRRAFAAGGIAIVSMLALGGTAAFAVPPSAELRPPGGQDERRLLSLCITCGRCQTACPQGAIGFSRVEDGALSARTPALCFDRGFCDFCEGRAEFRCVECCPTAALAAGFDPLRDKIGIARVDTDECLLYRSGSSSCSRECIAVCSFDAIEIGSGGGLVVDEDACNGCGACEYACPSASFGRYTGSSGCGITVEPVGGGGR